MNINKLLGSCYVDFDKINICLNNRNYLKNGIINPNINTLKNLIHVEDAFFFPYFREISLIKKIAPFCSTHFMPVFNGDILRLEFKNGTFKIYSSREFFQILPDAIAKLDNLPIHYPDESFDILKVKKISLIKENKENIKEYIDSIENIDLLKEEIDIIKGTVLTINHEFNLMAFPINQTNDYTISNLIKCLKKELVFHERQNAKFGKTKKNSTMRMIEELIEDLNRFESDRNILDLTYVLLRTYMIT